MTPEELARWLEREGANYQQHIDAASCIRGMAKEIVLLRAALAQQAEQGWQPIETAPRETLIFIGKFIDGEFKFGKSEMFYEQANELAGETFSGWVWSEDEIGLQEPTHWKPLPSSPKESTL